MQGYLFDADDFGAALVTEAAPSGTGVTLADARPYQFEWRDRVLDLWRTKTRVLGVAATGTGKSFGAALIARAVLDGALSALGRGERVIFVAHRSLLVEQAARGLQALLPDKVVEVEMGEQRARGTADVVVASLDSICRPRRLGFFSPKRYGAIIWDESHRYGRRDGRVKKVLAHFGDDMRHVGLTATPDRTDNLPAFDELAFEYDIWTAVEDGYLVRPGLAYEACGDIRLEGVGLTKSGEFDAGRLNDLMESGGPIAAVVAAARKWSNFSNGHPARRPTVIGCGSVKQAKLVAERLNEWHAREGSGAAVTVCCDNDPGERDFALRGFVSGRFQYITHFDVLTEGFDSDRPKVYVNARLTRTRWVYAQAAGRTLRPANDIRALLAATPDAAARRRIIASSSKPGAMIVDLVGTGHSLSCDWLQVYRRPDDDGDVLDRARKKARRRSLDGIPSDPAADMAAARAEVARERAERKAEEDRRYRDRWRGVLVDADLTTRVADPFRPDPRLAPEPNWARRKRPSPELKDSLVRAGFDRQEVNNMTLWQARNAIHAVITRRKAGLCSYKQMAVLNRYGVDATRMLFEDASATIDRIAANGWTYDPTCLVDSTAGGVPVGPGDEGWTGERGAE